MIYTAIINKGETIMPSRLISIHAKLIILQVPGREMRINNAFYYCNPRCEIASANLLAIHSIQLILKISQKFKSGKPQTNPLSHDYSFIPFCHQDYKCMYAYIISLLNKSKSNINKPKMVSRFIPLSPNFLLVSFRK